MVGGQHPFSGNASGRSTVSESAKYGAGSFGLLIGMILAVLTLLLDNKRLPAALVVLGAGLLVGLIFGTRKCLEAVRLRVYFAGIIFFIEARTTQPKIDLHWFHNPAFSNPSLHSIKI